MSLLDGDGQIHLSHKPGEEKWEESHVKVEEAIFLLQFLFIVWAFQMDTAYKFMFHHFQAKHNC